MFAEIYSTGRAKCVPIPSLSESRGSNSFYKSLPTILPARSLPGSVNERQLLASFSRMLPGALLPHLHAHDHAVHPAVPALAELLRFSSASHILEKIPQELQDHHRVKEKIAPPTVDLKPATLGRARKVLVKAPEKKTANKISIWDGWDDADTVGAGVAESDEELDLNEFGL